ncbi:MAG: response regulator transcription factor [Burkholderiaceae bacterium]
MRLLLIEDDVTLGEGLRDFLRAEGHQVEWAQSLAQADTHRGDVLDAVLVDWQLPDGSGRDWIAARRTRGDATPMLMITARDRLDDRVLGLDSGADDYLVKPFAPEELAARLRVVGRRHAGGAHAQLQVGEVLIDLHARSALREGQRVELTAREWTVLEALALRAGRIVDKGDLEQLVFGGHGEIASNALEVHVSSLRRKLGRSLIETVRGLGYRLDARPT